MSTAAIMAVALVMDALLGWPARLYARIGHPVTWIGVLIAACDRHWNRGAPTHRRVMGGVTVLVVTSAAVVPAIVVQTLLPEGPWGIVLAAVLAWPLIAARSLHEHVQAVATPLARGDLEQARVAVSMIVGRDPAQLDGAGIARAGLESLAENTSDGVVAPLFWGVVAGLPGLAFYKAVNTMDSMIGHRTERHGAFGMIAARLDDVLNLLPARLTAVFMAVVSRRPYVSLQVMLRDAHAHRSPNAGWPEAAMAGALGVRLSGPRVYADHVASEPWLNGAAPDPDPAALQAGLALYTRAMLVCFALLVLLAVFL